MLTEAIQLCGYLGVLLTWSDEKPTVCHYDEAAGAYELNLNTRQLTFLAIELNMPVNYALAIALLHELGHAMAAEAGNDYDDEHAAWKLAWQLGVLLQAPAAFLGKLDVMQANCIRLYADNELYD